MRKLVALVVSMAFALGVGLAVPQAFAQTPAPKDEKKGEMTEKKGEKKVEKKAAKRRSSAADTWGATAVGWRPSGVSGSPRPHRADAVVREDRLPAGPPSSTHCGRSWRSRPSRRAPRPHAPASR